MRDLAVIIPTYNGGSRLQESVASCALSGMSGERYGILVVDNCSADGSTDNLPSTDANGAPIRVFRNDANLGRTGNWNRGLEIAEREGYQFVAFLFIGDTWTDNAPVADLIGLMTQSGAVLGMAPLSITTEDGQSSREGARISIAGEHSLVETGELLQRVVRVGRLPFAPLQANIYRLYAERPLRFDTDPSKALNTDIESTVRYLLDHPGNVALVSRPLLVWRENPQRFFANQDPWFVMTETRGSLQRIAQATGYEVDWRSANAISLLTSAYELSRRMPVAERTAFILRVARYLRTAPGGLRLVNFLGFTLNKILRNKSYLTLPSECEVSTRGLSASAARPVSRYSL